MRAPAFLCSIGIACGVGVEGGDASAYACSGGFVPSVSVGVVGDMQVVGRGRQVFLEARTGDCKNDYPIEARRLEATIADDPDGTFSPLPARAEGDRLVWRADRPGVRYVRVALPGSRARPGQLVLVVTDPRLELSRPGTARIHLRPPPADDDEPSLQFLPANLAASARSAWRLPTFAPHWNRRHNVAIVGLPRGDYALRASAFGPPVGHMSMLGDGEYWIDRAP